MSCSSTSSTASLVSASSRSFTLVQPKDYSSAFATLQSAYGFGGQTPSISPKKIRSKVGKPSAQPIPAIATKKDYEAAFVALSSDFGFHGAASSVRSGA
ncbi:hypothetical protein B0H10DRAFT_1985725 [Mycena sp. CBHHK59/15]|nr:hypothetical protein B0H10DRAFT_1985725 [Mycena sp. CBHHK59/15]